MGHFHFSLCPVLSQTCRHAVFASLLVFNASFYWGFINFIAGFPIFIGWYCFVIDGKDNRTSPHHLGKTALFSIFLFLAHAIWLAVGILFLGIEDLRRRRPLKQICQDGIALFPIIAYSCFWYLHFSSMRSSLQFDIAPHWFTIPSDRLNPKWLINSILGGLHGPVEIIVLLCVTISCVLSIYTNRNNLRKTVHFDLLWASVFFAVIAFFAPDKYMNTIFFASRWLPIAVTFFVLALPDPKIPPMYKLALPLLVTIIFYFTTAALWYEFEHYENTGLADALNAIPDHSSVLGLDYVKGSMIVCGRPYLQTFSYAQVLHGSILNFSFAEHQNGIIASSITNPWTPGLEWMAERVRGEDCRIFDYALINAPEPMHTFLSSSPLQFKPITTTGQWRLYQCRNVRGNGFLFLKN